MVRQRVEHCAQTVIVTAKPGYFSSPVDSPVTTMLPSTLILMNVSAALLRGQACTDLRLQNTDAAGWLKGSLQARWPTGRKERNFVTHMECFKKKPF